MTKVTKALFIVVMVVLTLTGFLSEMGIASPIHDAAAEGNIEQLQNALVSGADINQKDSKGITPLLWAVFKKQTEAAKFLIQKGAKINEKGPSGMLALNLSCNNRASGEFIKYLLDMGADPNMADDEGRTALMFVAFYGDIETAKLLVEKGANVNVAINKGTPLITIAVVMDHAGFVQFLIENGADVNVKDSASHQMTPLMSAAQEGYLDIVKSLVQAKASLEDRNDAGMTALIHASKMGRDDVVQYLLESGADPNARDNNGMTALMHAASEYAGSRLTIKPDIKEGRKIKLDHVIVATSLLEKGADPMVKRNDGKTALMLVQDSISKRSKETSFSAEEVQKIYFNDMIQVLSGAETRKDKGQ